ncbi:cytochrome P450 3A4-like [Oppia nitens]|uniref:cytochrome P450 3A4-like n=1 Tax=Oppia nitens TaxID=1686743 RepID=UPI0023DB9064|nr:cytochrome P450 3A4-like [Oppia nitens]
MLPIIATLIAGVTIYIAAKKYFKHRYNYWERQGVPGANCLEPGIFKPQYVHQSDVKKSEEFGHIYGYYEFFRRGIVINDPDMIREVFVKHFDKFSDHRELYFGEDAINENLFNLPGDDRWKRIRNLISPAFTSAKLKGLMAPIDEISDQLVHNLRKLVDEHNGSVELDIRGPIAAYLSDLTNSFAFSIKTDALKDPNQPIVKFGRKIFAVEFKFSLVLAVFLPKLAKFLRAEPFPVDAINYFKQLTLELIKERRNEGSGYKRNDFLQIMIDANNEEEVNEQSSESLEKEIYESDDTYRQDVKPSVTNHTLSTVEMTAQCILFFVAGFDTTGSTLSHCLYYLAKYPDIQQKLYEEIDSIDDYGVDSLASLKYLNAVINETLRFAPPILRVERVANETVIIKNIEIPTGTVVTVTPYSYHRDEHYWDEPNKFKPDRFIGHKHNPYLLMPFGSGPRLCLGMRFALIEIRCCVAKVVKHFKLKITPTDPHLEYLIGSVFFSPKEVVLSLEKRQ